MNDCGTCTACCTLFPIEPIGKPVNTHCPHCDGGCSIYEDKPQTCTDFECAYLQGKNVPESLSPDKCGVIFTKKSDRIFTGMLILSVEVSDTAKAQIKDFNKQGYSVILLSVKENKPLLKLGQGHNANEIMQEYKEAINADIQH